MAEYERYPGVRPGIEMIYKGEKVTVHEVDEPADIWIDLPDCGRIPVKRSELTFVEGE